MPGLAVHRFAAADFHAFQRDAVGRRLQFQVVADVHRRRQEADFLGELLADTLDALEQLAILALVDQRNQAIADFQAQRIDRHDILPARLFRLGRGRGSGRRTTGASRATRRRALGAGRTCTRFLGRRVLVAFFHQIAGAEQAAAQQQEHQVRHARDQAHAADDAAGDVHHDRTAEQLTDDLGTDVLVAGYARDDHTGRDRDDQRRDLGHQAVTDGQQGVVLDSIAEAHVVLDHTDDQAADDVDDGNQDTGDGVTVDVLRSTVHRAIEFRFLAHFRAALLGFRLGDQAGVQVGIDCHLLARHRIQGKTRADLGDTTRTLGDDGKVNDGQDDEHDQADRVVAADQEVTEGFDDFTRSGAAGVPLGQHHAGRGHVQRQAQHGGNQQHGREGHEIERLDRVQRGQQHDHGHRDVKAEEQVQCKRRQRQDHHCQQHDDQDRRRQRVAARGDRLHPAWQFETVHSTPLWYRGRRAAKKNGCSLRYSIIADA
jgi:hypothetical protein